MGETVRPKQRARVAEIGALLRHVAPDAEAKARSWSGEILQPRAPDFDLGDWACVVALEIICQDFWLRGADIKALGAGVRNLQPFVHHGRYGDAIILHLAVA